MRFWHCSRRAPDFELLFFITEYRTYLQCFRKQGSAFRRQLIVEHVQACQSCVRLYIPAQSLRSLVADEISVQVDICKPLTSTQRRSHRNGSGVTLMMSTEVDDQSLVSMAQAYYQLIAAKVQDCQVRVRCRVWIAERTAKLATHGIADLVGIAIADV